MVPGHSGLIPGSILIQFPGTSAWCPCQRHPALPCFLSGVGTGGWQRWAQGAAGTGSGGCPQPLALRVPLLLPSCTCAQCHPSQEQLSQRLWGGCGVCPIPPTSLAVLAGGAEGQGWSGASAELPGSASIIDGFLKGINQGLLHHSWPAVQGELGSAARGIQHPPERGPAQPLPKENQRSLLGSPQKRFFRVSGVTCTLGVVLAQD